VPNRDGEAARQPRPDDMKNANPPRILVVDDEEAILETMTFTFQDDYEVYTATDARGALELLEQKQPIAAVLTDQRMPHMTGVEFVTEVFRRYPQTVRMVLTGFSDMDAIIQAINAGHVYAYITKPWEPEQLKQLMKQAVDHYNLTVENERLFGDLRRAKVFLEAVMDELDTGALAIDASGAIQAANRPVREYLALRGEPLGRPLKQVLEEVGLEEVAAVAYRLAGDESENFCELDMPIGGRTHRLRIAVKNLPDASGASLGRVILLREISHEPLRRRFDELLSGIVGTAEGLRAVLEDARDQLGALADEVRDSNVDSLAMQELSERISRTRTAIDNWLDVDDALAREEFPEAQVLQDRLRVAMTRWPLREEIPERVRTLARRVEEYYESGENPKQRVL
jgi:CheY-like chemotaxis protein